MTTRGQINSNFYQIVTVDSDGNPIQVTTGYIEPAGANRGVQFNDGNALGSDADFSYNKTTGTLSVPNITSANITGNVTNATHANIADVANSVAGANVSGIVANATHATVSDSANSVAGANVSGIVANANYASYSSNANSVNAAIANVRITGGTANYLLKTDGTGNLSWVAPPSANTIVNGTSNVSIPSSNGNVTVGVAGVSNIAVFADDGIHTVYNMYANAFYGNVIGNISGNIVVPGANTSVIFNTDGNADGSLNFTFNKDSNVMTVPIANIVTVNATGNVSANAYQLTTSPGTLTAATGQMVWSAAQQTMNLGMNNGVTQQVGLESYVLVKASADITNGQVVMFTGANGDNVLAAPANAASAGFKADYIIGVATQDIANNATGYITVFGMVNGLNTLAYTVGDILWYDPTSTTGGMTATQPTDPAYQIQIAAVTKRAGGDGHIQVRVSVTPSLNLLTDVTITTPTTGQALVYNGSNVWINGSPAFLNGSNANVKITGGSSGNVLITDGLGNLSWGSAGGTPGGSNTQLQFNNNGVFGGISTVSWNGLDLSLGNIANVKITGGNSNYFARTDGAGNLSFQAITSNLTVATRSTAVNIPINNYQMNVEARSGNVVVNVN